MQLRRRNFPSLSRLALRSVALTVCVTSSALAISYWAGSQAATRLTHAPRLELFALHPLEAPIAVGASTFYNAHVIARGATYGEAAMVGGFENRTPLVIEARLDEIVGLRVRALAPGNGFLLVHTDRGSVELRVRVERPRRARLSWRDNRSGNLRGRRVEELFEAGPFRVGPGEDAAPATFRAELFDGKGRKLEGNTPLSWTSEPAGCAAFSANGESPNQIDMKELRSLPCAVYVDAGGDSFPGVMDGEPRQNIRRQMAGTVSLAD